MTTETTESIESLELALAGRFPSLRTAWNNPEHLKEPARIAQERGWVPNVTTDGLLEALAGEDIITNFVEAMNDWSWGLVFGPYDTPTKVVGTGPTPREALMRAALKALE